MANTIKRLFIETDVLQKDELRYAQRLLSRILDEQGLPYPKEVFDEVKDFAWHKGEAAWEAVKRADEIYSDSSLVPLCGVGSYTGSPVVMNTMMKKAIEEKIKGKSLFFLRPNKDIYWDNVDRRLMKTVFRCNKIFSLEFNDQDAEYTFVSVDLSKLKK